MLFHHTEPVTYLRLLKVTVITMKRLTQEQVAQKLYGVFKTIETVSGKVPVITKSELMMLCSQLLLNLKRRSCRR
jgi:hypothetical protein